MVDDWEHESRVGPLGRVVDPLLLARHLHKLLERRTED